MNRSAILLVLASALAAGSGGCITILWKGTEAATGAVQNNEKPEHGPVLRAAEEGAGATHDAMKKVDKAEDAVVQKTKDAVTH
jgi:hypothetical protein